MLGVERVVVGKQLQYTYLSRYANRVVAARGCVCAYLVTERLNVLSLLAPGKLFTAHIYIQPSPRRDPRAKKYP
jgi:hypothetical protein